LIKSLKLVVQAALIFTLTSCGGGGGGGGGDATTGDLRSLDGLWQTTSVDGEAIPAGSAYIFLENSSSASVQSTEFDASDTENCLDSYEPERLERLLGNEYLNSDGDVVAIDVQGDSMSYRIDYFGGALVLSNQRVTNVSVQDLPVCTN